MKKELFKIDKDRPYIIGIGGKIAIACSVLFTVVALCVAIFIVIRDYSNYVDRFVERSNNVCSVVANLADHDAILEFAETRTVNDTYYKMVKNLTFALDSSVNDDIMYIFIPREEGLEIIFGISGYNGFEGELGEILEYDEYDERIILPAVEKGECSSGVVTTVRNDRNGDGELDVVYTSWAPIFDENNEVVAFVEMETDYNSVIDSYVDNLKHPFAYTFAIFAVILFVIILMLRYVVTDPIKALTNYVASYRNGKFDKKKISIKGRSEISYLVDSFNEMTDKMNDYIEESNRNAKDSERINTELGIASKIQYSMLNTQFPAFPERKEFDLHALMNPAAYVGGDFYDFFLLDDDHLALIIADVSGGSVSGAMFMMRSITNIKNWTKVLLDPAKILEAVNDELCTHNDEGMFVTVWLSILTISTGEMICSNAGHEFPVIKRKDGEFELLKDIHGLVIGGLEGMTYTNYDIKLDKGDVLFVYTDGVPECLNEDDVQFSEEKMLEVANQSPVGEVRELNERMFDELKKHMGNKPQYDDITMLCIKYNGR